MAACRIDSVDNPSVVRNMTIKRTALYQPTLKARRELEGRKPAYVRTAEHNVPSTKECTFTASNAYARKVIAVQPVLNSFYGSRRCKRIMHDSTKARRGEYDVATNALLRMADGHIGRKRAPGEDVLFAIGLGNFNTRKRLSSLHTSFAAHFVNKVIAWSLPYTPFIILTRSSAAESRLSGCWSRRVLHFEKVSLLRTLCWPSEHPSAALPHLPKTRASRYHGKPKHS